jgi:hypothetical protein
MQQPPLQQETVDTRQTTQQQIFVPQKGQLSPEPYQFATTYQLGTPLEEFKVVQNIEFIARGIAFLIPSFFYGFLIFTALVVSDINSSIIGFILFLYYVYGYQSITSSIQNSIALGACISTRMVLFILKAKRLTFFSGMRSER